MTSRELVNAVVAFAPETFKEREGLVFPLLLGLRRRGLLRSVWTGLPRGRRNLHGLPDADFGAWQAPTSAPAASPSEEVLETTDEATKALAFAPRLREEMRADLRAHVEDAVAELCAQGASREGAERSALRALGDPWKISVDLSRTARGLPTVVFPTNVGENLFGVAIYDLRVLLVILAGIVFVRVQVVTAYHIPTKSMEPTLHGDPKRGDRILVNKLSGEPERFDITVFDGWGEDRKNYVKRCVGRPGEKLDLYEGDLWVDGRLVRKDGDAYEALLFEVFDEEREHERAERRTKDAAEREGWFRRRMQELWPFAGDGECGLQEDPTAPFAGFRLKAPGGESAAPPQVAWHEGVEDGFVDPSTNEWREGAYAVPDLRLTASVKRVPGTQSVVAFRLTRGEQREYDARFDGQSVELLVDGERVAGSDDVRLPEGRAVLVSFSQVDHVLRVAVDGRQVLRHDLPQPADPKRMGGNGAAIVRVLAGAAWIAPRRLERDVYYVPDGPDENLARLGPDQFFMMGDNSSNSSDSRTHGPVHRGRLVGRPLLVVWPPERIHVPK
jgi:signal peptidase I